VGVGGVVLCFFVGFLKWGVVVCWLFCFIGVVCLFGGCCVFVWYDLVVVGLRVWVCGGFWSVWRVWWFLMEGVGGSEFVWRGFLW